MPKSADEIRTFIANALREEFKRRQDEERVTFEKDLPKLIEKRAAPVFRALFDGVPPAGKRGPGRPPGKTKPASKATAAGSRRSWGSLSDADKKKWLPQIVGAGKAKAGRVEVAKKFEEAEGFKLRESIFDSVQHQAAEAN